MPETHETYPRNAQEARNGQEGFMAPIPPYVAVTRSTESIPGGCFVVKGRLVDAFGRPLERES